jgi:mannosyltransferase
VIRLSPIPGKPSQTGWSWPVAAGLALVVAAGIGLRIAGLHGQSLWVDEVFSAVDVHRPLGEIIPRLRAEESSPPLYFWMLWAWTHAVGDGDFALRGLSLLFGVAAIPAAFALGASLAGWGPGLGAAALVAVNPFMVWYSQEARPYALLVLLGLLSLLALIRADRRPSPAAITVWASICALVLLTHYFGAPLVWMEAGWLLWRQHDRVTIGATAALAVLQVPLVMLALDQSPNSSLIGEQGLVRRLAGVPKQFLLGQFADQLDSPALVVAAGALAVATAAFVLAQGAARQAAAPVFAVAGALLILAAVPALIGLDRINGRNLILSLAVALVATGVALVAARRPGGYALLGLLIALFAGMSIAVATTPRLQRDDWRGVAGDLQSLPRPFAVVVTPGAWHPALERYVHTLGALTATSAPRSVAYVRVDRPPGQLTAGPGGFSQTRRVRFPSAEMVVFEPRRRRPVSPEALADPVGGTFAATVLEARR